MAAVAADRNLLFGLIALQNGLIVQDQLLGAFRAWTLDKGRDLADHLVERGDLDADDRAAVEALVTRHLKRHGGDVEQSLAAVPAGKSTRESLAHLGDPDIGATLGHVGSGHGSTEDGDADRTASYAVGTATSDGQRFRVLRPHAKGGLGAVFVALDTELRREVALKQILDAHADDPISRQRFLLEAEVTGGLEHPGIVPVYGLGTYGDGRPYYAMRFIRGDSLKEAIERFHADTALKTDPGRRSLELRKLLRRFIDVCNAIDYAHSRGVLHRDIKPANVILGKHGETLVVDWGLAKPLGRSEPGSGERTLLPSSASGSAETLPGSALGTPAYMSPEQAEGDLERLGPRSDVYSLGATLYCLLIGQPPYAGDDPGAILRAVQRGQVTPPRQLDPSIDAALEAVCKKAMALEPVDRYATPKALAEDIERWMAEEPVSAWREPWSRRARRWTWRNRTAVMTAAAAVLVALAGMAAVLAVQTRANRELRQANDRTSRERDQARQNFNLARKAVDDYLTRVGQNPLLKEQGLHELRQELLEQALGYYHEFLRQHSEDPNLRVEAAAAHERVGGIFIELGRFSQALTAYDQALALIEPMVRERPSEPMVATAQVRLEAGRLQALRVGGSLPEAIATFDRLRSLGEALLLSRAGTKELPEVLARAYCTASVVLGETGGQRDALQAVLRAHELAERAIHEDSRDLSVVRTLLKVSIIASELLRDVGRINDARLVCEHAIAVGETLLHDHPRDIEGRIYLAQLEANLGTFEKGQGRPLQALGIIRSCADRLEQLAHEHLLLVEVRLGWAIQLNEISQLQTDLRKYDEAEQSAQAAIDLFEQLSREVPSNSYYRVSAGRGYGSLGKALIKAGSSGKALAMLRKSVAILDTSDNLNDQYNLACTLALASTVADPAEGPTAADRQRRDAERAIATIRQVIGRGWAYADVLKTDPDFDSLRSRPDFQALMMDLAMPADPFARGD
jgi:serine/threonine-protein kinase